MKKLLTAALACVMLMTLCFHASAAEAATNIYEIGDVTVTFEADSVWNAEERAALAERLVHGHTGESGTYGLMCTLFGHKYETEVVIVVTHNYNSTNPKCLEEYLEMSKCTRCDETQVERISYSYIDCCV